MAEPTIRPIREADVKQIHEIEKACFAMPWSEESILHDVKENVVARWLVLDDGNGGVLAYAGMWFVLDEAHVTNIAVRPDRRGLGYGKAITKALAGRRLWRAGDPGADSAGRGQRHELDDAGGAPLEHGRPEPVSRLRDARRGVSQAVLRG